MPEQKSEPKSEAKQPEATSGTSSESRSVIRTGPVRPSPGESSDPRVHQLLARLEAHRLTLESHDQAATLADTDRQAAEEDRKNIRKELRELGYEVEG
jgi:hypothetical protein